MKIKAVLFDLDETVLDRSKTLELYLWWEATEHHDFLNEDTEKYIKRFIELDDNGSVRKQEVYTALMKEFDIQEYTAEQMVHTYNTALGNFVVEKRHAADSITTLKSQGLKIGLVSNGQSPFQEQKVESLGMTDLFDTIVVSEAAGVRKPDVEIFKMASRNLDVTPEECVFVGDNPVADIEGANNAGMYSVFIPTRRYPASAAANHVCRDMRDLPSVVIEAAQHQTTK